MLQKSNETIDTISFTPDAVAISVGVFLYDAGEVVTYLSHYKGAKTFSKKITNAGHINKRYVYI